MSYATEAEYREAQVRAWRRGFVMGVLTALVGLALGFLSGCETPVDPCRDRQNWVARPMVTPAGDTVFYAFTCLST